MKPMSDVFNKELKKHKMFISNMVNNEDINLIVAVKNTGEELALAYAGCKCEKCKDTFGLQYHHIVTRLYKYVMDFWKYESQRNYWSNIVILCKNCHKEMEHHNNTTRIGGTISKDFIEKIKLKYNISG